MNTFSNIRAARGMTLIEVMVALAIGLFLLGGTLSVYLSATDSQRVNEDVSRLQENARYALHSVKEDVRMAGYWGLTRELGIIDAYKGTMTQLAPIADDCEDRFYIDLVNTVWASNDANPFAASCIPLADYEEGTDVLVVRHVNPVALVGAPVAGTIYIRSDARRGEVFDGAIGPVGTFSAAAEDHELVTHVYYVRPYTYSVGDDIPSLRRLALVNDGGQAKMVDEEVIPGVEDFQVQFGIDDTGDGSVTRYVHPVAGLGDIRAVRLWVMARAANDEQGFEDAAEYDYAGKTEKPQDDFRRLLVTSTVQLRNMMPTPAP